MALWGVPWHCTHRGLVCNAVCPAAAELTSVSVAWPWLLGSSGLPVGHDLFAYEVVIHCSVAEQ